jgi:hypothetical protein
VPHGKHHTFDGVLPTGGFDRLALVAGQLGVRQRGDRQPVPP